MTQLAEIIARGLATNQTVDITYGCHTTRTNGEYITVSVNGEKYKDFDGDRARGFKEELQEAIGELKNEFPAIRFTERNQELHFHYPGFNMSSHEVLPISITITDESKEIKKTGIVTEKYNMVGSKRVYTLMEKYPDYEIWLRHGFGFRGSKETMLDKSKEYTIWNRQGYSQKVNWETYLKNELSSMACCDVHIQDNEIHINTFSYNDME